MLIVGDFHFDNPEGYNVVDSWGVRNLMLEAAYKALKYVCDLAEEGESIIVLGDVFEKKDRIPNVVKNELVKVLRLFKEKGCKMYFIVGNHDKNSEGVLAVEFLSRTYGRVIRSIKLLEIEGRKMLFVPFCKRDEGVLKILDKYRDKEIIVCGHVEVEGADLGYISHKGDNLFKVEDFRGFSYVFDGHYHKKHEIGNVRFVGSIYRTDWGDMYDKYVYRIDKNGKIIAIKLPDFSNRIVVEIKNKDDVERIRSIDLSDRIVRYDIDVDNFKEGLGELTEVLLSKVKTKLSFVNFISKKGSENHVDSRKLSAVSSNIKEYVENVLKEIENKSVRKIYRNIIFEFLR